MQITFKKLNNSALKILNLCMHLLMWIPCFITILFWDHLPGQIAQHFNGAGEIDIIGNKNVVIANLTINFLVYGFHFFAMYAFPYIIEPTNLFNANIINKISGEELNKGYIIILKLVGYLNIFIILMMLYALWHSIKCVSIGAWFVPVFLGVLVIEPFYFAWRYLKLRKEILIKK